ncbi:polysaccharide deacetylase family protein [Clostridium aminobutyricum]|uniref:Polysaccharide deacetylase family protein n=1 Tax=Clostridium aminobutyricum TaxID=33953 RepID=A0A939D6G5_CLOAM|nr:polysaccharide deacetylase family protein [Clostridium aminobutyricum]MBN7771916.1 polysaccharide deacetylase family protein [Clostridium aminobutyricum]
MKILAKVIAVVLAFGAVMWIFQAVNVSAALSSVLSPNRELPIYSVQTAEKKIAISFDAAWGDESTVAILDILDQYNVKTTFFLVKFWAETYPADVAEIHARGHEIGNHSATHPKMTELSEDKMIAELSETSQAIEKITGEKTTLFRPPFGDYNNTVISTCEAQGYKVIQWSVDSLDWKNISTEQIVDRVTREVKPGDIILFHNNAEKVTEYLPLVLENLQKQGFKIVPIGELIYYKDYKMDHTGKQCKTK